MQNIHDPKGLQQTISATDTSSNPLTTTVLGHQCTLFLSTLDEVCSYIADPSELTLRRLLCSPYSGVDEIEAKAICAVTSPPTSIAHTIQTSRVLMSEELRQSANEFLAACEVLSHKTSAEDDLEPLIQRFFQRRGVASRFSPEEALSYQAILLRSKTLPKIDLIDKCQMLRAELKQTVATHLTKTSLATTKNRLNPHPEAPANVRRRRTPLSASALNTYAECPRKWYYRYVCQSVEDKGSGASTYGTAVHWALELFHRHYPKFENHDPIVMLETLQQYTEQSFVTHRDGMGTPLEYELQLRRAHRTMIHYLEWFLTESAQAPFTIIGNETELTLRLRADGTVVLPAEPDLDDTNTFEFIGYIDRLDLDDHTDAVTVIDYKTGSISANAEDYRKKIRAGLEFQLPLYYWARTAAGDNVKTLALVPLKDQNAKVSPIELEIVPKGPPFRYSDSPTGKIGIGELLDARKRMANLAAEIHTTTIESYPVAKSPDHCVFCSYKAACRERPPQTEERFGH